MCLSIAMKRPDSVLARGEHAGHEWMVTHNGRGSRCGYVKVEPGHPWHGKSCDDVDAEVHGGLTFADPDVACDKGGADNGYWFGFDTCHGGDRPDPLLPDARKFFYDLCPWLRSLEFAGKVRTQEYVEAECRSLCEQAARAKEATQ